MINFGTESRTEETFQKFLNDANWIYREKLWRKYTNLLPGESRENQVFLSGQQKLRAEVYYAVLHILKIELERCSKYEPICERFNFLINICHESVSVEDVKVRPHYAARHTAAKCSKAAWQKLRHATSIYGLCVGLAAACRSMLRGLKIRSANCRFHQKKPRSIWWVKGFQNGISQLGKKSDQVRRSRSTVLVTWRRSARNFFFMWTRSHWRHMPSNFCRAAKLQCVAFCRAA